MTDPKATQRVEAASGQIGTVLDELVDGWCDHRNKDALRILLPVWPSDDWAGVLEALRTIRVRLHGKVTPDELETVNAALFFIERFVERKS